MGSKYNQKRLTVDVDRLSSLPDKLIHKIFSDFRTKDVVRTSVLSSRWRFIWTSIPCLNLSTRDFETKAKLSNFVRHVLSRRNSETEVSSVKLRFGLEDSQGCVKEIMDYAFSHNIQKLDLSYERYLFLKIFSLSNGMNMPSFEIPALTTLSLCYFDLCNIEIKSLLSKCVNLKNLTLCSCKNVNSENFKISHPRLSNLTLDNCFMGNLVNVDAPKLDTLNIRNWFCSLDMKEYVIKISAPHLTSFAYMGNCCCLSLFTDGFNSLKEAALCISNPMYEHSSHILSLLQHLRNVRFLTLNMEILEILSSDDMVQILPQPFIFANLKRLNISLEHVFSLKQAPNKSYLLDIFPGATLEEIVVQSLVVQLHVLLEEEKNNSKTNRGKRSLQIEEYITATNNRYREFLGLSIEKRISKDSLMFSKLSQIEVLLTKLPASRRAMFQPYFASLCAEIDIIYN